MYFDDTGLIFPILVSPYTAKKEQAELLPAKSGFFKPIQVVFGSFLTSFDD
jgi:hypothetical protein